ncbi:hypothetical protein ASF99_04995 [Exiguobacterium sp. Leaf187]|uniref:hypothetical protein n=1 Tax=Exiguobacterium sp. Leaf187 TaxID=1736294 RepID=UPI0006F486B2|nr:hypothetical protein [Exiguobacterium sp. Leaf187]KQS19246.1 hypothetical protein ASF99_04995 [Exiguobacterium sp. Leaf187]
MNNQIIDAISELILYKGPSMNKIIEDAQFNKLNYNIHSSEDLITVSVNSSIEGLLSITDIYVFNKHLELIKRIAKTPRNEKVLFDRLNEINNLINQLNAHSQMKVS